MDWSKVGAALKDVAPTLAKAALNAIPGGSAAEAVGKAAVEAAGAAVGSSGDQVAAAVAGATPDQIEALKKVDDDFATTLAATTAGEEKDADTDREGARSLDQATGSRVPVWLTIADTVLLVMVLVLVFAFAWYATGADSDGDLPDVVVSLVTAVVTAIVTGYRGAQAFWLGTPPK